MNKVLFVATVSSHINAFHIPYLKWFKEQGYEVHVASNGNEKIDYCDKHFNLPFERFPLKPNNIKTYKELKKIINENNYDIIHCHTPVGGVLTRLAARRTRKKGTKVLYTAHGFHFYKGAPLLNWLIYYPIEKICARWTDCLITINTEDYERAERKFKAKKIELVHGVGMNTDRFNKEITEEDKKNKRKELGIKEDDMVFTYVAELNKNKNQILLIETISKLKEKYKNIKLLLVGNCENREYYKEKIHKRNLDNEVLLLGRRKDIQEILSITDIYLASSLREGLPVNIMEAMYMGIPIVATDNRGHRELIRNKETGVLLKENTVEEVTEGIIGLINDNNQINNIKESAKQYIKKCLLESVLEEMKKIYRNSM